jgi:hypothetical protein
MSTLANAPKFVPQTNADILNAIRKVGSTDYQRRIPAATKANIQDTLQALLTNRPSWNEFSDALLNRVGLEIYRGKSWSNKLGKFKRGMLNHGDTIEEIAVGLAEGYVYDADRDYLEKAIFGQERPEVQAAYHKINRQVTYKLTVNASMLRRAFDDEFGLSTFISSLMDSVYNADEVDEFAAMTSLFHEYFANGGFHKVNVPDIGASVSTEADAKVFLRKARALADTLTFMSRDYNAAGMPVFADRDELELFITPEANAAIDVGALAAAFNVDYAAMPFRITVIPAKDFRIPGVQAILTTRDFFIVADTYFEIMEQVNAAGRYTNHFLHHDQVLSTSLFVPAVLFWTGAEDVITINETPVTDIDPIVVLDKNGNVATALLRGELYELTGSAVTDPENGFNDAVRFTLEGVESVRTYIAGQSSLWVAADELSEAITITATATDDNTFTEVLTLPVNGDRLTIWPDGAVVADTVPGIPA